MATTARQSKPPRKGPDPNARRTPAWGPRASPAFSPGPANARLPNGNQQQPAGAFPPLNGARPSDNNATNQILQRISGLTGTTITILTKTNVRYEGVVQSTSGEGDTQGVTLKDVKDINNPGAPLKEQFFIAATNILDWSSGPADAKVPNGADTFKTDTDISQRTVSRRERELQAWQPDNADGAAATSPTTGATNARNVDELTFGPGASGAAWDQFAVNEQLFGVKAEFDEEVYTTKLDRNAPDFKEKERKAAQIASEIMGTATNNPHIAEERVMNLNADGSSANEEEKYGAVVRGANAYIPPGARKANAGAASSANATTPPAKADLPKVAVNAPDGAAVPQTSTSSSTPSASKVPSPAPTGAATPGSAKPADAVPAFRNFVSTEKDRLLKKKQALMKSEMDKRLSDLVNFSKSFKLNKPIPDDLVPILAKDEDKQRQIKEKTVRDAEDQRARAIGVSSTLTAAPVARALPSAGIAPSAAKAGAETARQMPTAKASASSGVAAAVAGKTVTAPSKPGEGSKKISMFIQPIPPFKGKRSSTSPGQGQQPGQQPQSAVPTANGGAKPAASPLSPTAVNRLNVNASSFRPTAKGSPFSPGGSPNPNAASSTSSPKVKPAEAASPQGPPNPFFGPRPPKRSAVHIKDDFNPFKNHKVTDAAQVAPTWPYSGKRYMQMFPPIPQQPQQQSPPMAPPGPPPPMPPTYEEDPAAQAARGYVYAYPPYGYPGQVIHSSLTVLQMVPPMMPGMAPPPPGAYIPGPYMQPMPYPMPPPNGAYLVPSGAGAWPDRRPPGTPAMYPSTPMGQMPPPQAYMPPPPPPGTYPPPPNGAGPRPSMPPTPIPSHAHPYYHQSPQLQHAMPYPMMMPPPGPGGVPPHPYDPSGQPPPPVPMGGHA
ncbi:hypothetical protein GY45DRAFT_1260697 [Cubamyces sp. BRFM 1775]|nr:hypothetical protein GY45DRAFT_1260697 [Cubamyces sp. BRFM 1775]